MTLEKFKEMRWEPGMSVAYKFRNVDSPKGETIRSTPVKAVEFPGENDDGSGIYGFDTKGRRIFVHRESILEVRFNFKGAQNEIGNQNQAEGN